MRRWLLALILVGCSEDGQELFFSETFDPPPPTADVPCQETSPWTEMEPPTESGLADIWSSGSSIWFAGGGGTVLQYASDSWIDHTLDIFPGDLMAIHGTADDNVWVVGRSGFVAHYDGADWSAVESGTNEIIVDVWATTSDQVWMIGDEGVRRFDGTSVVVEPAWPDGPMNAIWASGPDDVRIVANEETFVWNGRSFGVQSVSNSGRLTAVWGKGTSRVWALGHNGDDRPGFAKFVEGRWLFGMAPRRAFFFSLWGVEDLGLWAGTADTSIFYWDENRWCREYAGGIGAITAFWGPDHTEVWAAGSVSGSGGETRPILLIRRGPLP